jgi:hypothetical protein
MELRHQFHSRIAQEEHKLLSATVRERLMRHITEKKNKLMKEKEQLDIGDSNAFLLHPNQFSITNPASPGGAHKRATRGTGRKPLDPDDPASIAHDNKRKRKALFQEVESQSPAPGPSRDIDVGIASPYRDAKTRTGFYHQYEAPAYSIDRLFTQKELDMYINTAAIAAQNFLQKQYSQGHSNGQANGNGVNGNHIEEEGPSSGTVTANDVEMDDDATPSAPGMERMASHHATRGATKALTGLASVATGDFPLGAITYIPAVMGAKANSAPVAATPLTQSEIDSDLAIMSRDTGGDDHINDTLLERAIAPLPPSEYTYQPPDVVPDNETNTTSLIPPNMANLGGVPMSAQSSQAGHSEFGGGVAMSRNNSSRGVAMQRSTSNTGSNLFGGPEGSRRVRGRLV